MLQLSQLNHHSTVFRYSALPNLAVRLTLCQSPAGIISRKTVIPKTLTGDELNLQPNGQTILVGEVS